MSNEKKYLDYEGLQHLWSKISMEDYPNNDILIAVINAIDENKVDKVNGKELSTNDFTDEYKIKLDNLENIEFQESDPTVPAWAKEATKPTYTAEEVGALPNTTEIPEVPTNVSAFTNDAGYLTEHQSLDNYALESEIPEVPQVTVADAGKFIRVSSNGKLVAENIPNAEGASF